MGKARTLKFLFDKGYLGIGDYFKYGDIVYNVRGFDVPAERVNTNFGAFSFADKVYPITKAKATEPKAVVQSPAPKVQEKNGVEFTISFSCKTDFEYIDKESKTMEEALEKARLLTPWQMILKSEPVDVQDEEVNIFGLISNEV